MRFPMRLRKLIERWLPARRLRITEGDSLPTRLPWRGVVLARDDNEDWCVGMRCPCGCGDTIELMLICEVNPRWTLSVDEDGLPSLKPSVWKKTGCRSHFWVKHGRIEWCN